MTVGDARFNIYQPQLRAASSTAATGRGAYTTESAETVEAVEAITPTRATTGEDKGRSSAAQTERSSLLASSGDKTRGQIIDILV